MMRTHRYLLVLVLAGVVATFVEARIIAPAPIAERVALAPVVIKGTVTSIEDKGVQHDGAEFKIAIVKVADAIKGAGDVTHVRVAFQPVTRFPVNSIQKDTDVLLFLTPVKGQTFYTTRMYYDIVNKNSPQFAKEVEAARTCGKALASATTWLATGKPEEKALAAAMLILQYRPQRIPTKPGAAVDAAQSKAILLALADADWKQQEGEGPLGPLSGRNLFQRINPTAADGWTPPADFNQFETAAKKWLKDNAGKFVFKKMVPNAE